MALISTARITKVTPVVWMTKYVNVIYDSSLSYTIMEISGTTVNQMINYYLNSGKTYPQYYTRPEVDLAEFCQIYYEEAKAEGVKVDVAFGNRESRKQVGLQFKWNRASRILLSLQDWELSIIVVPDNAQTLPKSLAITLLGSVWVFGRKSSI